MNFQFTELRRCPHCGLVWAKIIGCDGATTCGERMSNHIVTYVQFDNNRLGQLATFCFTWLRGEKRLQIAKNGVRQLHYTNQVVGGAYGIGCGRSITWNAMAPVAIPQEFAEVAPPVTVEDIPLVPEGRFSAVKETIASALQRFGNALTFGTLSQARQSQ